MPPHIPVPDPHQPYHNDLFVGRVQALQIMREWLAQREKRLFVLVAPPAMGKTWVLKRFSDEFQAQHPIFWLAISIQDYRSTQNNLKVDDLGDTLHQLVQSANQLQPTVRYDPLIDVSLMAEMVAQDMGEQCSPEQRIFIVVDQVDQLRQEAWDLLETRLLQPLASHPRLHFLVALRNNQRLRSPILRRSEKRLDLEPLLFPTDGPEVEEQIRRLAEVERISEVTKEIILDMIREYLTVYPGLNTYLFYHAHHNVVAGKHSLDEDFWQQALQKLVDLSLDGSGKIDQPGRCVLVKLLEVARQLEETWTIDLLGQTLSLPPSNAFQWLNELQDYWLVIYDRAQGNYRIIPGLYEFLGKIVTQGLVDAFLHQEQVLCR